MWGKRVRNPLAEKNVQSQARLQGSWECMQIFMPDREAPGDERPREEGEGVWGGESLKVRRHSLVRFYHRSHSFDGCRGEK